MFKLLIADDEQFIRKGIISILKKNLTEEIQCIEAANGQDALMKAREMALNLIITDISMPGCDGLEFIRQLREENKMIPIVILSGYDNFEYAQKAIRLGVKEYIMKPIKKQEFITLIQEYIDDSFIFRFKIQIFIQNIFCGKIHVILIIFSDFVLHHHTNIQL